MLTLLLVAQLVWSGPKLTPEEGARILAASPGLSNRTGRRPAPDGPAVVVLPYRPGDGPYGRFAPPTPARRLDGTSLTDPPWSATAPFLWPPILVVQPPPTRRRP